MFYFFQLILLCYLGHATGKERGVPPWTSIVQRPSNYFDPDQLPEGFTLLDPSKMRDLQIEELLNYWFSRQRDGIGFRFQGDEKVKRKREETPDESDDAPDEDSRKNAKQKKKGKEKVTEDWIDEIQPDSRRRKRRMSSCSASSESFDFQEVNMMGDSDSDGVPHPGPSSCLGRSTRKVHFPKDVGSGQLWFHSDYLTVNSFI